MFRLRNTSKEILENLPAQFFLRAGENQRSWQRVQLMATKIAIAKTTKAMTNP